MAITDPAEGEWLSSNGLADNEAGDGSDDQMDDQPPVHPVPTMQGAFEESMTETLNESEDTSAPDRKSTADSFSRRKLLLEQEQYERTVAGRWKQRPGEKFHPLWKLVAQISFGMHLLQQAMAKSDEEVIKILQTHVDEVDGFLERTTEDFDLAQGDIDERIRYLRLPLEHGQVFDNMLHEYSFRTAIIEGNEKIEHIVDRTAAAMNDALKDVQKGLDATRELAKYLTRVDKTWGDRSEEHEAVYLAMIGNTEGWSRAFQHLQQKGNTLGVALVQLGGIIAEMQRRAGIASRKILKPSKFAHGERLTAQSSQSSSPHHSISPPLSPNKPLPRAPETVQTSANHQPPTSRKQQKLRPQETASNDAIKSLFQAHAIPESTAAPGPVVPTVPTKNPSRRVSFGERTRSLTRKLSFFKENDSGPNVDLAIEKPSSGDSPKQRSISPVPMNSTFTSATARIPASNVIENHYAVGNDNQTSPPNIYRTASHSNISKAHSWIPPYVADSQKPATSCLNSEHQTSQNEPRETTRNLQVTTSTDKSASESAISKSDLIEATIMSNARDLPLRDYRSSEIILVQSSPPSPSSPPPRAPSRQQVAPIPPKRTSSLRAKPIPPPANSSATPSPLKFPASNPSAISSAPKPFIESIGTNDAAVHDEIHELPDTAISSVDVPITNRTRSPSSASVPVSAITSGEPVAAPSGEVTPQPSIMRIKPSFPSSLMDSQPRAQQNRTISSPPERVESPKPRRTLSPFPSTPATPITALPAYANRTQSSAALRDFLASTPPPSSPAFPRYGGDVGMSRSLKSSKSNPKLNSAGTITPKPRQSPFNAIALFPGRRPFIQPTVTTEMFPSPPNNTKPVKPPSNWKKMFGGGGVGVGTGAGAGGGGQKKVKISEPIAIKGKEDQRTEVAAKKSTEKSPSNFAGVGKDGVWISRKNFLKT